MKLTRIQLAALEKLADGEWHSLSSFAVQTIVSLHERGLIDPIRPDFRFFRAPRGGVMVDFRLTDAGRAAIGAQK